MHDTDLDHPHARKPWAIILIVLIGILFGTFWYYERNLHTTLPAPTPFVAAPRTTEPSLMDPADLQAAAINMPIPDFSKDF